MAGACRYASGSVLDAEDETADCFVDSMKRIGGRVYDDGRAVVFTRRSTGTIIGASVGVGVAVLAVPGLMALVGGLSLMSAALGETREQPTKKRGKKSGRAKRSSGSGASGSGCS